MVDQLTVSDTPKTSADTAATGKKKRAWSAGEQVFNYSVYGGISWIVNELLSTVITESIYKGGRFYQPFEKTVDFLHKNVNPLKWGRRIHYLASEMFVMCIGGTLLVPPVKYLEDHKGKIVRSLDRMFHSGTEDPKLKELHKEMDEAPKQSWASLWKGRALVLVAAITMHFTMGAENETPHKRWVAPTTHLFKGTFMEKYSNLTRAMQTLTRDLLRWVHPDKAIRAELTKFRFPSPETLAKHGVGKGTFIPMQASEGLLAGRLGNTFGYVLSVSAAMATLFFVSSRIFAASRDKNKTNTSQTIVVQPPAAAAVTAQTQQQASLEPDERDNIPSNHITQVDARSSLKAAAATQLANSK